MNLIFFIHKDSFRKGMTLQKIIDQNFTQVETQTLQTFNAFKSRLKQISNHNKEIFILLADSKNRLNELTGLVDLMEDKRIILIIPDDSEATISMAHQFFPRYFTFINNAYDDLCDVLNKMINQNKKNINTKGGIQNGQTD